MRKGQFDVSLLDPDEAAPRSEHSRSRGPLFRLRVRVEPSPGCRRWQAGEADFSRACHDGGPLQHIAQFPHVARPIMLLENFQYFIVETCDARAMLFVKTLQHGVGNQWNIFLALAQGRNDNLEDAQTVEEVLAEVRSQFPAGRRQHPHVYWNLVPAAQPANPQ